MEKRLPTHIRILLTPISLCANSQEVTNSTLRTQICKIMGNKRRQGRSSAHRARPTPGRGESRGREGRSGRRASDSAWSWESFSLADGESRRQSCPAEASHTPRNEPARGAYHVQPWAKHKQGSRGRRAMAGLTPPCFCSRSPKQHTLRTAAQCVQTTLFLE